MKCIETAFNWHSGESSPLYSFASTRKIHSEDHRDDVQDEIDKCIEIALRQGQTDPEKNDIKNLRSMSGIVGRLPVGRKLPDPYR